MLVHIVTLVASDYCLVYGICKSLTVVFFQNYIYWTILVIYHDHIHHESLHLCEMDRNYLKGKRN